MNAEFIAIIVGFITILLAIAGFALQVNNRIDRLDEKFEKKFEKLESKIELKIESLNKRIDSLYDILVDLYKTFVRKDAA